MENNLTKVKTRPGTLILTDWGANFDGLYHDPKILLYELLLLSLLYDEILIQDEVFVLSNKLSNWFSKSESILILRKLFELNTIVVLKHPIKAYPDKLKELAIKNPIEARSLYIQFYGSNSGKSFIPTQTQKKFYSEIELCLNFNKRANRFVGSTYNFDIMSAFSNMLHDILSKDEYSKWLKLAFPGITQKVAAELVGYIENPQNAYTKVIQKNSNAKILFGSDDKPIFNRSFGFQIADLYKPANSNSIKHLIQTTFAAPFCWREQAVGRYSGVLKESLWESNKLFQNFDEKERRVSVEAHVEIPMNLPDLTHNFPEIIQKVRNSDAGKELRKSIRSLGKDIEFKNQIECWKAVAAELERFSITNKKLNISTTALNFGKGSIIGTVINGLSNLFKVGDFNCSEAAILSLIGAGAGVLCDHGLELLRHDLREQNLRSQLEKAVDFRCNWIPIPNEFESKYIKQ
jgi:hypothetical protein